MVEGLSEEARIKKNQSQAELLRNRLIKRYRHLKKWARRTGTEAYRLYDRDIPEIPLVLDLYGDALSGALYERPYEKDENEESQWLECMKAAIGDAIGIPGERIFLKQRKRQRGDDQYDRLSREGITLTVKEGDLQFEVNLSDYLDTGLFLDHRATRRLVGQESAGKKVLNLFCYTAAFSVYASFGGAKEVDSVDLSNTYLDWAARNFQLNGRKAQRMTPEEYTNMKTAARDSNRLIRADAIRFLDEAAREARSWDLIILDPPTFSNSKKMEGNLDIRRDSNELIGRCLRVLSPQGTLWFSTNARGFKLLQDSFPGYGIKDMKALTTDEDFREKQNRSCYTIFHER